MNSSQRALQRHSVITLLWRAPPGPRGKPSTNRSCTELPPLQTHPGLQAGTSLTSCDTRWITQEAGLEGIHQDPEPQHFAWLSGRRPSSCRCIREDSPSPPKPCCAHPSSSTGMLVIATQNPDTALLPRAPCAHREHTCTMQASCPCCHTSCPCCHTSWPCCHTSWPLCPSILLAGFIAALLSFHQGFEHTEVTEHQGQKWRVPDAEPVRQTNNYQDNEN